MEVVLEQVYLLDLLADACEQPFNLVHFSQLDARR